MPGQANSGALRAGCWAQPVPGRMVALARLRLGTFAARGNSQSMQALKGPPCSVKNNNNLKKKQLRAAPCAAARAGGELPVPAGGELLVMPQGWVGSGNPCGNGCSALHSSGGTQGTDGERWHRSCSGEGGGGMGRSKQAGWEGGKKRKGKGGKSQEQKDERAGGSTAAAPRIPWAAITGDWDISRTQRGL